MLNLSQYNRIVFDRYQFQGLGGCLSCCAVELLPLPDGHTVAILTELDDNLGTSVTHARELLASRLCDQFGINPSKLFLIEHYGRSPSPDKAEPFPYERLTFVATRCGNRWIFDDWQVRKMNRQDWVALGLEPRNANI